MTNRKVLICGYCQLPAGSPVARHDPGNPASPLVGLSHDACYLRFLNEELALLHPEFADGGAE
jgi:hypothetical protein